MKKDTKIKFLMAASISAESLTEQQFIESMTDAIAGNDVSAVNDLIKIAEKSGVTDINVRGIGESAHLKGATPLIYAAALGHEGIVDLLLKNGAYTTFKTLDNSALSASQIASTQGHSKIALKIDKATARLSGDQIDWQKTLQNVDNKLSTPQGRSEFASQSAASRTKRFEMGG